MVSVKKILILPDAGPQNPFQYQMIGLLEQNGFEVKKAPKSRFFATLNAVNRYQPDILYYDWIQSFILGKTLVITLLKCICFYLEIQYITKIQKKPIFHTLHNIHNHSKRWIWIERQMYKFFLKKCTRIRVYSQTTKDKVVKTFGLPPQKIHIIEDVPFHYYYPNTTTKAKSRTFLSLPNDSFVYLFLGMVKPYKGIEDLIISFQTIKSKNDILIIAGSTDNPAYVEHLHSLINKQPDNIHFINEFIPVTEVQYYFNAANVVVLPFKNIEHSGSVDLAMSFKKPVITLKTDFTTALLTHQEELLFTSENDVKEKLLVAKTIDEEAIGETNFCIADSSNYKDFLSFFTVSDLSTTVDV